MTYHGSTIRWFTSLILSSMVLVVILTGSARAQCPDQMISYWKLDEAAAPYSDSYGVNDATCTNCPASTTGIVNGAQDFNGVDDEVNVVDDNNSFDWGADASFSIEYWMKTADATAENQVVVGRDDDATSLHWWVGRGADGKVAFYLKDVNGGGPSISGTGDPLNDGKWHHIVAVKDGSEDKIKIYVDGNMVGEAMHDYTDGFSSDDDLNIGYLNYGAGFHYNGLLDELAIYGEALSVTEIQEHHASGLAGNGYCKFAPVIISSPVTDAFVGHRYIYDVNAEGNPTPTYELTYGPDDMSIDPGTGLITWTPVDGEQGLHPVKVEAGHSTGTDTQTFFVNVAELLCPGMISYWKLDEAAAPYSDSYGVNDATCTKCPLSTTGIVNGAQDFNGVDDEVNVVDDNNSFDWDADDSFSIEYWMKTADATTGNKVVVGRDDDATSLHWWVGRGVDGKVAFYLKDVNGGGPSISGTGDPLNDGKWHHIVAVKDGSEDKIKIYVDGNMVGEAIHDYTDGFSSDVDLNIGYLNYGAGFHYNGLLDELAIYDQALSVTEIQEHYNAGLGRDYCEKEYPGNITAMVVSAVDPDSIPESEDKPENLIYGLIDMEIEVSSAGDTALVKVFLPDIPAGYKWYKYIESKEEWIDFSRDAISGGTGDGAEISGTEVTLYITDNGLYDDDQTDRIIKDPSGLGTSSTQDGNGDGNGDGGGGGSSGGCFIATAAFGSLMEPLGQTITMVMLVLVVLAILVIRVYRSRSAQD